MGDELNFYQGDIVEILHLLPEQADKLPNSKYFVGARYRIDRVFEKGELYAANENEKHYTLDGFPQNSWLYNTYFTAAQLRVIERKQNCFLRWILNKMKK